MKKDSIQHLATEFNVIGISGVFLILLAYFLLHIDKLSQRDVSYSLLNFLGSGFILISLYFSWNLSSGIIETAWFLISFLGLTRSTSSRGKIGD
ncbi:CBU_0592 family membrane protein [Coxiella endosymbiont of Amblyomma sculptum]|uniref:CBU_0592 family membrane protein n=1 Tax=Coxiella endosymbiont of Amblyomma sculptum TaxID=2487929 RepID=UPI001357A1E5|nr:hypothetical protein [Coxiella endosymbiont of Amblyomma sculptum]